MQALIAIGAGFYSGGFQQSPAVNVCAMLLFWAGLALLSVGFWHLRKAPDVKVGD